MRSKLNQIVAECIDVDMASMRTNHSSPADMKPGMPNSATQSSSMQMQQSPKQQQFGGNNFMHQRPNGHQGFTNSAGQVVPQQQTQQMQ